MGSRDQQKYSPHRLVELITEGEGTLFAVMNGYRSPDALSLIHGHDCPVAPVCPPELGGAIGPQLTQPDAELLKHLLRQGWGHQWGIYLRADASLEDLAEHFGGLVTVTPGGQNRPLRFPFYEPAILRPFLMASTAATHHAVFGPVSTFLLEHDEGRYLFRATQDNPAGELCALFDSHALSSVP